jgi:4'-phosphopantetheinyl transferase
MRAESRQRSFLLGRAALRTLLADLTNTDPSRVALKVLSDGRVLAPETPYHVSISHSGDRALAVVSTRRIGVDIEQIVERPESLLRYVLHRDEVAHVERLPVPQEETLFLCWTIKEAVLKALGTGLMRSPKSVRMNIDYENGRAIVRDETENTWEVIFERRNEYMLALAYEPVDQTKT